MLDTLTDIEVVNSIMSVNDNSKNSSSVSLIDKRLQDLRLKEMTPLDHKSTEYKELSKYLIDSSSNSHALKYRLEDIFRIERPGKLDRFNQSKFSKLEDKNRLLWHGSRTPNYGGSLSQGLRIAPASAPANGYAFWERVYLVDVSSKSANYCMSSMSGATGLLLPCKVECSNPMDEVPTGDSETEEKCRKKNFITTKGTGQTVPLKWKDAGTVHESLTDVLMVSTWAQTNFEGATLRTSSLTASMPTTRITKAGTCSKTSTLSIKSSRSSSDICSALPCGRSRF
jgi:poly [ADP-ribose] polymerase 2/3/4